MPAGYIKQSINWVDDENGGHWEIINKYIGSDDEKDIIKKWIDLPEGVTPPKSIDISLFDEDGNLIGTTTLTYDPDTGTSTGSCSSSIFSIDEDPVPEGYVLVSKKWVDDDNGGHWEIINKYVGTDDDERDIIKIWENLPEGVTPPEALDISLFDENGNLIGTTTLIYDPETGISKGSCSSSTFSIEETQVPEGYVMVRITWVDDDNGGHWEIVNKYDKHLPKPIPIIIDWGTVVVTPPEYVNVNVINADGDVIETVVLEYDPSVGDSFGQITKEGKEPISIAFESEPEGWRFSEASYEDGSYYISAEQKIDIVSRSINLPESGCIIRGNSLTWTVVTSDEVSWLKFVGTYPVDGGTEKKLTMLYKAETYLANPTDTVSVVDNQDGTYTWTITVKFIFSVDMDKIVETWRMYYKKASGVEYISYEDTQNVEPVVITIGKNADAIVETVPGYDKYTLVSASCEAGTEPVALNTRKDIIIVTTDDCTKVRISVNGKNATYQESSTNTTVTSENGLKTWVISYKFTQTGSNEYSVATRGTAWTENPATFTVDVI